MRVNKGKGDKADLDNDRGIFTLTVLRMILDKVIYMEEYEKIDQNMSDSNAGARKEKKCRNHSFIVNGILHEQKIKNGALCTGLGGRGDIFLVTFA